jgi:very-short-patch-repair endonuclease
VTLRWTDEDLAKFQKRQGDFRGVDIDAIHRKQPPKQQEESKLERRFTQQLADAGIAGYQRNYFFMPDRDFELDFAWAPIKVYVEVQGMSHRIKGKFRADIEKRALAMLAGWRGLEVDGITIKDGRALEWLRRLLNERA